MGKGLKVLPRDPKVENKYNLRVSDISRLVVLDYDSLTKPPFWRNDVVQAWCISECVRPNPKDFYGTYDLDYWIGIYDKDAKAYKGKIRLSCSSFGGMCNYKFKDFFNPLEIDDVYDLILQEKLLSKVNWLIDNGILGFS